MRRRGQGMFITWVAAGENFRFYHRMGGKQNGL